MSLDVHVKLFRNIQDWAQEQLTHKQLNMCFLENLLSQDQHTQILQKWPNYGWW